MNVIPTTSFTDFSPRETSDNSSHSLICLKLESHKLSHALYFALYKMNEATHSGGKILEC